MNIEEAKKVLGATSEARLTYLLNVAQKLSTSAFANPNTWRKELSIAIEKELDAPTGFSKFVYLSMNNLSHEGLKKIRVARIGEESEALHYAASIPGSRMRRRKRVRSEMFRRDASIAPKLPTQQEEEESDEGRAKRWQTTVNTFIDDLPAEDRTARALAAKLGKPLFQIESFLFQYPKIAERLSGN